MKYADVFMKLNYEVAIISFFKKDGTMRLMLGTRNLNTVNLKFGFQGAVLGGHDSRCNINNGNLAVYDLILGDARSFNIDRLIDIQWAGEIRTLEELEDLYVKYNEYCKEYEKTKPKVVDLDSLGGDC